MGELQEWLGRLERLPTGETWEAEQEWERVWWDDCVNTYGEETKQLTYAHRMGLEIVPWVGRWPVYDLAGKSVVDLGGGPVSMLLKCANVRSPFVVDPCRWPQWVYDRYKARGIMVVSEPAERFKTELLWDEAWIYNVLQHVEDPERVIATARRSARVLRIFDWVETPASPGHPHTLTESGLNQWIGANGTGRVEMMNENGCVGLAYYGSFPLRPLPPLDPMKGVT